MARHFQQVFLQPILVLAGIRLLALHLTKQAPGYLYGEKGGKVFVCNWNGTNYIKQSTAVLDISPEVGNWRDHGMLGFALDPDFEINGLIYVLYVVDRHYLMNFGTGSYNAATVQIMLQLSVGSPGIKQ